MEKSIVNTSNDQIFKTMKEFALIFRLKDISDFQPSPEQLQERMNWLGGIAAQNRLVDKGNTLLPIPGSAKTVKPGNIVTDGPYAEIKEFISGKSLLCESGLSKTNHVSKLLLLQYCHQF